MTKFRDVECSICDYSFAISEADHTFVPICEDCKARIELKEVISAIRDRLLQIEAEEEGSDDPREILEAVQAAYVKLGEIELPGE